MNITISTEKKETFSEISNNFIDYYMADANGDFVKVYLYLVRLYSCGRPVSVSDIADYFQCTDKDVCRAIRYWISQGILSFTYDTKGAITGIILKNIEAPVKIHDDEELDFAVSMLEEDKNVEEKKDNVRSIDRHNISEVDHISGGVEEEEVSVPEKKKLNAKDINNKLIDEAFRDIMGQAEAYFNRELAQSDVNMLIYIFDELKLPVDVIEYLLEHCATIGKTKASYVEKVAIDWYGKGFKDREEAKTYTDSFNSLYRRIFKELGIANRVVPTPSEIQFIKVWQSEFGFDEEMIAAACSRAIISRPNSASFAYVNTILDRWHKEGIKTPKDVEISDEKYTRSKKKAAGSETRLGTFGNYKQSSTDDEWDELTEMYIKEVNNK